MTSRIGHTMIRVLNLELSKTFYTEVLGMNVMRETEYPDGRFTLVFMGYAGQTATIELTYNWDQESKYNLGDAFGHIAILDDNIERISNLAKEHGFKVLKEPSDMKFGKSGNKIAFIEDPDGYKVELIQSSK